MRIKKLQFNILDDLNIEIPALSEDAEGKLKGGFCSVKTFGLEGSAGRSGIGGDCSGNDCTGGNCSGKGCVGKECTGNNCSGNKCIGTNCLGGQCAGEYPTDTTDDGSGKTLFGMSLVF